MERRNDSRKRTSQRLSGKPRMESGYQGPRNSAGRNEREEQRNSGRPQGGQTHRKHTAAHSRRRKRKIWRKRILMILGTILLALVIAVCVYGYRLFTTIEDVTGGEIKKIENTNLSADTVKNMKKYWTVAVFGVDAREGEGLGKGVHSDVIMVCNVNQKTGDIKLLSVYRDTYAKVADKKYGKINDAYFRGGPQQAIESLNQNFDLQIDDYITVNWKAVIDAINILGGVDIDITDKEFKYINAFITETVNETGVGSVQLKKSGFQHLDGVQAVAYSRLRLMDTDFQRTERQRKVIGLCMEKAKKADFATLNNVMVTVLGQVSSSIEVGDLVPLAKNVTKYNIAETSGFPFELTDTYIGKQDCVVPTTLSSNVTKLHSFLYGDEDYVPSASVKKISAEIEEKAFGNKKAASAKSTTKAAPKKDKTKTTEAPKKTETVKTTAADKTKEEKSEGAAKESLENAAAAESAGMTSSKADSSSTESSNKDSSNKETSNKETSNKETSNKESAEAAGDAAAEVTGESAGGSGKETASGADKTSEAAEKKSEDSKETTGSGENGLKQTKPAETDSKGTKPTETKPSETKPSETKLSETKPSETKLSETKPKETKPKESGANIFTEKPSEMNKPETKPEGPGAIKGNGGVSAPGQTVPVQ